MKKNVFKSLSESYQDYNAWKATDSFPIKSVDREILNMYEVIEFVFEGMYSNRSQENYSYLLNLFKKEIVELLNSQKSKTYIFVVEAGSSPLSRVKSYKGLIRRDQIDAGVIFQKEYKVTQKESRLAFVAEFDGNNDELFSLFFDYRFSFLISTNSNYLNENFLDDVTNLFDLKGFTYINLLSVMLKFCSKGDLLYRIGGNNGEEYWSLQLFKSSTMPIVTKNEL